MAPEINFDSDAGKENMLNPGNLIKEKEIVPRDVPTDLNVGQPGKRQQYLDKRLPSSELLTIGQLGDFMEASTSYHKGKQEGWDRAQLLTMMDQYKQKRS